MHGHNEEVRWLNGEEDKAVWFSAESGHSGAEGSRREFGRVQSNGTTLRKKVRRDQKNT